MTSSIIFFAPLKNKTPSSKIGGAEMGCLKTLEIYESHNINVELLPKPTRSGGLFSYVIGMFLVPAKLVAALLKQKKATVHIVGFYRNVISIEWIIMMISRFMGHSVIYEIRNGSMVNSFVNGNVLYKKALKDLLLKPEIVLCQGMEYVSFIKDKWNVERTYYPNFLQDAFIPSSYRTRDNSKIQLVYFGRVTKSKNVLVMVDILDELVKQNLDSELTIIGASDPGYQQEINQKITQLGLDSRIKMPGRKNLSDIVETLSTSHYFIFPTNESQEGHSNSLTEAMGLGVVPIVSKKGFNESICGDSNLAINSFDPKLYAKRIQEIESSGEWTKYSKFVQERIKGNFTQTIVAETLLKVIHEQIVSI